MTPIPIPRLDERLRLGAVARGERPADLVLRGGSLLNVFTGEIYPANVAIAGERIAYAGTREDMIGPRTRVLDVAGRVLVPGYIDPHVHPANLVTPSAFARHILPLGTTTVVADTLQFWQTGGARAVRAVADALARSPLKFFWMLRVHGQARVRDEARQFPLRELARTLAHPWVLAIGEVTRWPEAHRGDRELLRRLDLALAQGRRVEGHTAGASAEKLPGLAVAGLTSDHEPITAKEVLERARQGIAVMLRESSLRPDLSELLAAVKEAPALVSRLMLTADGSMPAFVRAHGFVDNLIRLAMAGGIAPVDAYRMATLNPATYYGLDAHVGSIAPGPLRGRVRAAGSGGAAAGDGDRARPRRGRRRTPPHDGARAAVGAHLHLRDRAARGPLARHRGRLRAAGAADVSRDPSRERRHQPPRGTAARPGRSPCGARRSGGTMDRARGSSRASRSVWTASPRRSPPTSTSWRSDEAPRRWRTR